MIMIGSMKQEQKIRELASIAHDRFPHADILALKGAFRFGAKWALGKSPYASWADVARLPVLNRRKFFNQLLAEAEPLLEGVVGKNNVKTLIRIMKAENENYL